MIEELEDLEEEEDHPKRSSESLGPIKGMNKSRSKSTHCDLLWKFKLYYRAVQVFEFSRQKITFSYEAKFQIF